MEFAEVICLCRICVEWFPIYRIPDAPLNAKFLTYYSLSPTPTSATHYGALCSSSAQHQPSHATSSSTLCLPTVGLKLCHLGSEDWLDAVQPPQHCAATAASRLSRTYSGTSSGSGESLGGSSEEDSRRGGALEASRRGPDAPEAGGWDGPRARRLRLQELSREADRMSQREGLLPAGKANRAVGLPGHLGRHDDYTFFVSRHEENPLRL